MKYEKTGAVIGIRVSCAVLCSVVLCLPNTVAAIAPVHGGAREPGVATLVRLGDSGRLTTGLGVAVAFDSRAVRFVRVDEIVADGLLAVTVVAEADALDVDANPLTDSLIRLAWASPQDRWAGADREVLSRLRFAPAAARTEVLSHVTLTLLSPVTTAGSPPVRLVAAGGERAARPVPTGTRLQLALDPASGRTRHEARFAAAPGTAPGMEAATSCSLDADGNGSLDALTDGILIVRYLFGFGGSTLAANAVGTGATRTTGEAVSTFLGDSACLGMLDADGNGSRDALTDGILILRYLFGYSGTTLASGAVGTGATRPDGAAIAAFLDTFQPPPPVVVVKMSPRSVTLNVGATQPFNVTVSGSSNPAVTWTATGGSVSSAGLFTAPATAATCKVRATSAADPTKSAEASVSVSQLPTDSVSGEFDTYGAGTITTPLGVSLDIPRGAVPKTASGDAGVLTFSIEKSFAATPTLPTGETLITEKYRFGPERFNLAQAATLTLPVSANHQSDVVHLYRIDPAANSVALIPSVHDAATSTISATTRQFSEPLPAPTGQTLAPLALADSPYWGAAAGRPVVNRADGAWLVTNLSLDHYLDICPEQYTLTYPEQYGLTLANWHPAAFWRPCCDRGHQTPFILPQGQYRLCLEWEKAGLPLTPPGAPVHWFEDHTIGLAYTYPEYKISENITVSGPPIPGVIPGPCPCQCLETPSPAGDLVVVVTLPGGVPLTMVRIPGGTFMMGSPSTEKNRSTDETLHQVTLTSDYYIGKYEVTQGQWKALMGTNPSTFPSCGDGCPVETVSWDDISEVGGFLEKLNAHLASTGQPGAGKCRLPTEAEWERAARGGSQTRFSFGDALDGDDECGPSAAANPYIWWCANSGSTTHPVGSKLSNQYGLFDIHGSVFEWVQDLYGAYPSSAVTDPTGPTGGSYRVLRSGSWFSYFYGARSATHGFRHDPDTRIGTLGFRLAGSL